MPRKNKRKSPQQQFSEKVNSSFVAAAGVRTGGQPDLNSPGMRITEWMRQEASKGTMTKRMQDLDR